MKTSLVIGLLLFLQACGGSTGTTSFSGKPVSASEQTGVARYEGQLHCTAFLLETNQDAAPAYALTNGHCAQNFSDPDTPYAVVRNQPTSGELVFFYTQEAQSSQVNVPVTEVVYSTMNGTDIAVLKLNTTLGQLRARGIKPVAIQGTPLAPGRPVSIVGAPVGEFLRATHCEQGVSVDVTEFVWYWTGLSANNCANVGPGMSGSPVFDQATGQAVGILNTTTAGMSQTDNCYLGSPCEVRADGTRPVANTSYAIPTRQLAGCFRNGLWSPESGSCPLPVTSGPSLLLQGLESTVQHAIPVRRWAFEGDFTTATRVKFIRAGQDSCAVEEGYQNLVPGKLPWLPTAEGVYLACVKESNRLAVHPVQVDNTPPSDAPIVNANPIDQDQRMVTLEFVPPEISGYVYSTSVTEAGCQNKTETDFIPYIRLPLVLKAPVFLCLQINDRAGNRSKVWVHAIR